MVVFNCVPSVSNLPFADELLMVSRSAGIHHQNGANWGDPGPYENNRATITHGHTHTHYSSSVHATNWTAVEVFASGMRIETVRLHLRKVRRPLPALYSNLCFQVLSAVPRFGEQPSAKI